jgi:hypothetical protein
MVDAIDLIEKIHFVQYLSDKYIWMCNPSSRCAFFRYNMDVKYYLSPVCIRQFEKPWSGIKLETRYIKTHLLLVSQWPHASTKSVPRALATHLRFVRNLRCATLSVHLEFACNGRHLKQRVSQMYPNARCDVRDVRATRLHFFSRTSLLCLSVVMHWCT